MLIQLDGLLKSWSLPFAGNGIIGSSYLQNTHIQENIFGDVENKFEPLRVTLACKSVSCFRIKALRMGILLNPCDYRTKWKLPVST